MQLRVEVVHPRSLTLHCNQPTWDVRPGPLIEGLLTIGLRPLLTYPNAEDNGFYVICERMDATNSPPWPTTHLTQGLILNV